MESNKEMQPELFEEFKEPHRTRKFKFRNLAYYPKGRIYVSLSYEKSLFLLIGLILTLVLIFTLGVEKGKELSGQITTIRQQNQQFSPPSQSEIGLVKKQVITDQQHVTTVSTSIDKLYTIQVASLTKEDLARKEIKKLKAQGYEASVIKSDKFYLICVGGFSTKQEASAQFTKLRETYKDCYIRKIK